MDNFELEKEIVLLALINNAGILRGRARLQKLLFLLENEENLNCNIKFEKRQYGPYSNEISEIINRLIESKIIIERTDDVYKDRSYYYMINPEKQELVDKIILKLDENFYLKVNKIIKKFGNMPLTQLLKYVYSRYPSWTTNSIWKWRY